MQLIGAHGRAKTGFIPSDGLRALQLRGYRGRIVIMELLRVDASIDELIARRATT